MRRIGSQSQMRKILVRDDGGTTQERGKLHKEFDSIPKHLWITHHKRGLGKPCDEALSVEEYGRWRQEHTAGMARLKKQLRATQAMKLLIDDGVRRYQTYYNRWSQPNWAPAHEQAAVFWFGEWRPSAILTLVISLSHLFDASSVEVEQALSQLTQNVRIEEAVIDEEMIEIQANCIIHLPFGPRMKSIGNGAVSARLRSELNKIHGVIAKAQKLRATTLEMVVKKVLSQTDGARFLVAFAEIQDAFHDVSVKYQTCKGAVFITELAD